MTNTSQPYGQEDMEQNLMVLRISFKEQEKLFILKQERHRQKQQVAYYMNNAKIIMEGLKVRQDTLLAGGVNAPYVWLETPDEYVIMGFL